MKLFERLLGEKMTTVDFYPKGPWLVEIGEKFVCKNTFGFKSYIDPKNITAVKIITNDRGPLLDDVFWKIESIGGDCYLVNDSPLVNKLFDIFQTYENFDYEAIISSMLSCENKIFTVWSR